TTASGTEVYPGSSGAPAGRRRHQLYGADGAFAERTLAVGQVVIPHAAEALIKALRAHLVEIIQEADAPVVQGTGVIEADILDAGHHQLGAGGKWRHISATDGRKPPGKI